MSRAERRKSGVKEKPKTYVMTDAQLDEIRKAARLDSFLMALSIPVLVLSDKFNFDEDMLNAFVAPCMTWMQCVRDGDATMKEIMETSEKLANMEFAKRANGVTKWWLM